jgi:hypothetical protein
MSDDFSVDPRTCAHCDVAMTPGYLPDVTRGLILRATWVKWPPVPSWISGLRRKRGVKLIAYRCPQCATVELVAPYDQEDERSS